MTTPFVNSPRTTPLVSTDGEPGFDEPWQAQVLGIVDGLVKNDIFSATEWSDTLGSKLVEADKNGEPDTSDTYYRCVIATLESLLESRKIVTAVDVQNMEQGWRQAYLNTPHGKPVNL